MPIPTNNSRPSLPYTPDQSLPNNQRFTLLDKRPPTAPMLDAEFNSLQDDVNRLAQGINEVQAGSIPGSDDPLNAHKVLKTDGQGALSFTLINSHQVARHAVVEGALAPQSVTTPKIGDGAVTSNKLAEGAVRARHLHASAVETDKINNGAVTTPKIANQAIRTAQIAPLAVTTEKVAEGCVTSSKLGAFAVTADKVAPSAVTTDKIADLSVTTLKVAPKAIQATHIDSQSARRGGVLMAQGSGNATFQHIRSSSFDGSLILRGTVLGSSDGETLSPQFLPVFSLFETFANPHFGRWRGYNIQSVVFGGQGVPTPSTVRITFNGGYDPAHYTQFWLVNPGPNYSYFFRGDPHYPKHYATNCDLIIPLNGPSGNKFILYYYPEGN